MQMLKVFICLLSFLITFLYASAQPNLAIQTGKLQVDTPLRILDKDGTANYGIFEFENINKYEILKRLFDNCQIDTLGMAAWKGNYYDYSQMLQFLSIDGKFHTSLDTILFFNNTKKEKSAVVVFATWVYVNDFLSEKIEKRSGHYVSTPIGIALFTKSNTTWKLHTFKKYLVDIGSSGDYKSSGATVSLMKLANNWTCLRVNHGEDGGMGEYSGAETLYSIEQVNLEGDYVSPLEEIFAYRYVFGDNGLKGGLKLKAIPQKKSYSLLTTTIAGRIKTYKYYPEYNKFIGLTTIKNK